MAGMTHCPLLDIETLWLKWIIALLAFLKQEENVNKHSDRKQCDGILFPLSPHQHHCPRTQTKKVPRVVLLVLKESILGSRLTTSQLHSI